MGIKAYLVLIEALLCADSRYIKISGTKDYIVDSHLKCWDPVPRSAA